ncbi:DEAD/DEAH box helicase [Microbacterium paraoxydans]
MALWEHQIKAVSMLREYLRNWRAGEGAALVSMPTGTEKSAVIAQLVANVPGSGASKHMMVVTPWKGLARQIGEDIDRRAWSNAGLNRPSGLGRVRNVASAKAFIEDATSRDTERTVFVTTFAMALEILNQDGVGATGMAEIFAGFGAVIVDECHYEPAPSWSKAIRAMRLPICLFTATPFRNDNRMFDLDTASTYRYSHSQAETDGVLRRPQFHVLENQGSPGAYVADLLAEIGREGVLADGERVLVRCATRADVSAVARALHKQGKTVLAVHEAFEQKNSPKYLQRSLPGPASRPDVDFYVHQHKLTEGFDDPLIRVLAVYGDFGNDRARVQQVGRILRNPQRVAGQVAHVFAGDSQLETTWDRYLRFDANLGARAVATDALELGSLLESQPEMFYWDRLFRQKFDFEADDAWHKLRFAFATNIMRVPDNFDIEGALSDVERDLGEADRKIVRQFRLKEGTEVFLYVMVRNSPILRDDAFVETELGYAVVHLDDDLLLYSSPHGAGERLRNRMERVEGARLAALLDETATVTSVSLTNNDLSDWAVRSRSLSARDLAEIAAEVGDSTYGFSTAYGHFRVDNQPVQRYTGVKNGRVRDRRGGRGTFAELLQWFEEIKSSIRASGAPSTVLDRYSLPVVPTAPPIAAHVLIDIAGDSFRPEEDGGAPLQLERSGGPVSNGKFKVTVDGRRLKAKVRWDEPTGRFILMSRSEPPYRAVASPELGFWEYINRTQLMRVATTDGLVYSKRNFWEPRIRDRDAETGLLSVLTPVPELQQAKEEKGDAKGQEPWPDDTVFGVLEAKLLPNALGDDPSILCTDLGAEIADFIGFDADRVIFAHAKGQSGGKSSKTSASALHEIVSQAMKSLRYMTIGNEDVPKTAYWGTPWHMKASKERPEYGPATRLRLGTVRSSGAEYWTAVNDVIQSHASTREVWLVLGRSLSKKALTAELRKTEPSPAALQCHALLTSAWSASQQCGVRLRVFCSE